MRKDTQRDLSGSVNLLMPADQFPPGQSALIENFRADRLGRLESRLGMAADASGLPTPVHSLVRYGDFRYAGCGSELRYGSTLASTVTTGFDGTRLGFSSYQGFAWVMNRSRQRRVDTINSWQWGIAAPTSAPTAAAGATASAALVEFDQAEPWSLFLFTGNESSAQTIQWETTNKQSGTHSLHVEANPAGQWQVRQDIFTSYKDLTIEGQAKADDILELWFYASNPKAISEIYLELWAGASRLYASATVDPSNLNQGAFTWTKLEIRRALDGTSILQSNQQIIDLQVKVTEATNRGDVDQAAVLRQQIQQLYDEALKQTPYWRTDTGFNWAQVAGMAVSVTVTEACDFYLDKAQMIGGVTGALEGEFLYAVTYGNDEDWESNPSPESTAVTVRKQSVALTGIPVSPDSQVTRRFIYRYGGGTDRFLRIGTINDNATTTYTDTFTVDNANTLNLEVTVDNDPPPAARLLIGPIQGRLIAASSATYPNRYWYTPVAEPWKFPGSTDDAEGNWEDVGYADEAILAMTQRKRRLYFFKERSIWVLPGDPDTVDVELVDDTTGILGVGCAVNAGPFDYIATAEGVFSFNGDSRQSISDAIDPIFRGDYVDIGTGYIAPMDRTTRTTAVLGYRPGRLYFSYPEVGNSSPNVCLVYEEATRMWRFERRTAGGFTAFGYEGTRNNMLGAIGSAVFQLDNGTTDAGNTIPLVWQSPFMDQGAPDSQKTYSDVTIDYRTATGAQAASSLTVTLYTNNGATTTVLGTLSSISRTKKTFQVNAGAGLRGVNAALRIDGGAASTCAIYAVYLHFNVEGRVGLTYDTGVFDLGMPGVKQVNELEIPLDSTGTVTWALYSDLPGGQLTQRATGTIVATGTRKTVPVQLSSIVEGRYFRLTVTNASGQTFEVFGSPRLRVRRIGVYVDGAAGEIWRSDDTTFSPLPALIRELDIDADTDGPISAEVMTDLPGGALTSRAVVTVNTETVTPNSLTVNQRVPGMVKGRQVAVRFSGSYTARIFAVRVFAGGQWVPLVIPASSQTFEWINLERDEIA